jgi:pyruvate,water dikinase
VSWLSRVFGKQAGGEAVALLRLRTTRFRQLLRSYGALSALLEDAAEKQGGGFILDRQYVIALAEQVAELADAVVFDLNVITSQQNLAFYEVAERLRAELRSIVAQGSDGTPASQSERAQASAPPATVNPAALAAALARSHVLYRQCGQVACRGVAAGPVCNLGDGPEPSAVSPGSVLVAADLAAEDRVLATIRRAGALLLDRGSAAGTAARLARELRIPAIVGLGDATSRLVSGIEVTVDADENVVYLGPVAELLDYYRSGRLGAEEEEEYRLLRSVRRAAFPLTLAADQTEVALPDCRTLHDLVHLARSLAGDALCRLLTAQPGHSGVLVGLGGAAWCQAQVVILADSSRRGSSGAMAVSELPSRPLRAFLEGLSSHQGPGDGRGSAFVSCALHAVGTDEHTLAVSTSPRGCDMLDATADWGREANVIYCRFAARGDDDPAAARGALAAGVLARLGFAVTTTNREVNGWIRGLPLAETEERVRILGHLSARLAQLGIAGWARATVEPNVEAFMRGCA